MEASYTQEKGRFQTQHNPSVEMLLYILTSGENDASPSLYRILYFLFSLSLLLVKLRVRTLDLFSLYSYI